jgi:hypothetical protein
VAASFPLFLSRSSLISASSSPFTSSPQRVFFLAAEAPCGDRIRIAAYPLPCSARHPASRGRRPASRRAAGPSRRLPMCVRASESARTALLTLALWIERTRARRRARPQRDDAARWHCDLIHSFLPSAHAPHRVVIHPRALLSLSHTASPHAPLRRREHERALSLLCTP